MKDLYEDGSKLELFTNAYFQSKGYFIESNLKVTEKRVSGKGNIDILEIDILAKKFENSGVKKTLVECKRGCNFNDLLLFSGVSNRVRADENIMVIVSNQTEDISHQAKLLNIKIETPEKLLEKLTEENMKVFHLFYDWQKFKSRVMSKEYLYKIMKHNYGGISNNEKKAYDKIRLLISDLDGKIWRETDLVKKANLLSKLFIDNKDFIRSIARIQKIKPMNRESQFYIEGNEICLSAALLTIELKISYIVCAVECALLMIETDQLINSNFKILVEKLKENKETAILIPKFLQYYICIFGGIFADYRIDLNSLSMQMGISLDKFEDIVRLLKELFTIEELDLQWGFEENLLVMNLKNTPIILKARGVINREKLGIDTSIFVHKEYWIQKIKHWEESNNEIK